MSKVAVIYHSGYGHTKLVAEHIAKGANAELIAIDINGDITDA
jgi:NAD(P)H dehydrogenase (quinone)